MVPMIDFIVDVFDKPRRLRSTGGYGTHAVCALPRVRVAP